MDSRIQQHPRHQAVSSVAIDPNIRLDVSRQLLSSHLVACVMCTRNEARHESHNGLENRSEKRLMGAHCVPHILVG